MNYPCNQSGQFLMFDPPKVLFNKETRLWRSFLRYHVRNPHVYDNFRSIMLEKLQMGEKFSCRLAAEAIRWNPDSYSDGKNLNVNNNMAPYYLRTFLEEFPEYIDCFDLRPIKMD